MEMKEVIRLNWNGIHGIEGTDGIEDKINGVLMLWCVWLSKNITFVYRWENGVISDKREES